MMLVAMRPTPLRNLRWNPLTIPPKTLNGKASATYRLIISRTCRPVDGLLRRNLEEGLEVKRDRDAPTAKTHQADYGEDEEEGADDLDYSPSRSRRARYWAANFTCATP